MQSILTEPDSGAGFQPAQTCQAGSLTHDAEYWKWRGELPDDNYFHNSADLTDPDALEDVQRMQQTAPDVN